jgi:glycosyltransferase involved in cell wall biosynthesis
MGHAHDVAIYSPFASLYYERTGRQGGGAELQTTFLARGLAERGVPTAHIVFPLRDPVPQPQPAPTVVERSEWQREKRLGGAREVAAIWHVLARADARAYVVRGSGGYLVAAAAFCRARRRRLIFASSNDLDFEFERPDRDSRVLRAYRRSIRSADRVVLQTRQQESLAKAALPGLDPVVIPSFSPAAETADGDPEYFLWADRMVPYKHPERYVELARSRPELRFKMVLSPTSEMPQELVDRVHAEGDPLPNLELLPGRPREQLLEETRRAAAIVSTSAVEGMPNTFLEAWARGVPVLSLNVDPDDRIAEHEIGIVAGGSMERLAEGASKLWHERELRAAMGERARQFVVDTHSPDVVADRWLELLREVLRGAPR